MVQSADRGRCDRPRYPTLWIAAGLLAVVLCLLFFDQPVAWFFHSRAPVPGAFRFITVLLGPAVAVSVSLLLLLRYFVGVRMRHLPRQAEVHLLFVPLTTITAWLLNEGLKFVFGRFRPAEMFDFGRYGFEPFHWGYAVNSFPSGHATAAFSFLLPLAFCHRRMRPGILALASFLALSRVILTAHFLGDILAGATLAYGMSLVVQRWLERLGTGPTAKS